MAGALDDDLVSFPVGWDVAVDVGVLHDSVDEAGGIGCSPRVLYMTSEVRRDVDDNVGGLCLYIKVEGRAMCGGAAL